MKFSAPRRPLAVLLILATVVLFGLFEEGSSSWIAACNPSEDEDDCYACCVSNGIDGGAFDQGSCECLRLEDGCRKRNALKRKRQQKEAQRLKARQAQAGLMAQNDTTAHLESIS